MVLQRYCYIFIASRPYAVETVL